MTLSEPKFNTNLSHALPDDLIPLNVTFEQKDEAKSAGAKWNTEQKFWYVKHNADNSKLHKWLPKMHTSKQAIIPDLVPSTAWYSNLRDHLSKKDWSQLSSKIREDKAHRCEICGSKGRRSSSECHEVWEYDDINKIQRLTDLISVCHACHLCHHMGLAQTQGMWDEQVAHLAFVNKMSFEQAEVIANMALETWQRRSEFDWQMDISLLAQYGLLDKIKKGKRGSTGSQKKLDL